MKLCEKTGQRLRNKSLEAKNISAGLSYVSEGGRYKSMKTPEHIFDTPSIFRYANSLLFSNPLTDRVRMLAISVSGLIEPTNQLSFFSNTITKKNLARACDKINNTYGDFTIASGEMFGTGEVAQDRIGFRKVELT